ncbi:hypothetical protein ACFYO1_29510 [Nocardia sp. NPDC006044]|uniref:hypothetical protein n=1 Tax=Nocardia sp. NPDC006044 TaxID=3364306 RepID=UPI0036A9EC35
MIFDCNIYLDVASLTGPPFTWAKFNSAAARLAFARPDPTTRSYPDSLLAVAVCQSGNMTRREPIEVVVSDHIQVMTHKKAVEILGWQRQDADTLLTGMIGGLVEMSNGYTISNSCPDGNPPLDHEDGLVYGTCRFVANEDPLAQVYCVTRDKPFVEAYRSHALRQHTKVLTPTQFRSLVRAARNPMARVMSQEN